MSAACPVLGNLGNAGCPALPVEGIGLDVIQAPKPEPRIMRYELNDYEWTAIKPMLPMPLSIRRSFTRRTPPGCCGRERHGATGQRTMGPYTTCYNRFVR
jgi:hypothetical protein